jgi:hypothetical protein
MSPLPSQPVQLELVNWVESSLTPIANQLLSLPPVPYSSPVTNIRRLLEALVGVIVKVQLVS